MYGTQYTVHSVLGFFVRHQMSLCDILIGRLSVRNFDFNRKQTTWRSSVFSCFKWDVLICYFCIGRLYFLFMDVSGWMEILIGFPMMP